MNLNESGSDTDSPTSPPRTAPTALVLIVIDIWSDVVS